MEIFKFISWWWFKRLTAAYRRVVLLLLSAVLLALIAGYVTTSISWAITTFVFSIVAIILVAELVETLTYRWQEFKRFKEREADAVINALKGRR